MSARCVDVFELGPRAELREEAHAVDASAWHDEIEKNQVDASVGQLVEGVGAIAHRNDAKSALLETIAKEFADIGIVVNDQDSGHVLVPGAY